mmetsp:Transcript_13415/g.25624  ORF Transcript_13415/g.25624 Transcript_13415/m.25624 type:complete len:103 (-) Transcript_13415:211-519(-)
MITQAQNTSSISSSFNPMHGLQKKLWPGFIWPHYYSLGWFFAAAGVAQVGVAIGVGVWKLIKRRREYLNDFNSHHQNYDALPSEVCILSRLGEDTTSIASAA